MGAKTWMLVYADGEARAALARRPASDRAATEAFVRRLFPGETLKPIGDGDLCYTNPPDNEIYAGCFPGVSVVAAAEFGIDYPSRLPAHFIAAGGGGIPVYVEKDGTLEGVDAVIDKDRASALLAHEIGAEMLIILTGTEKVALNFGKPEQQLLDKITTSQAEQYLQSGHFPAGSMGPKIEAAIAFIKMGGARVIITSIEKASEAVFGNAGTVIERG